MGSVVQNLAFDELTGYEISSETFSPTAAGRVEDALQAFAPKMIAMGGLALFGSALVVAFRIIALDAIHQLREPAIDFAICGAIAFLGLCISWIHLGDNSEAKAEDVVEDSMEFAVEPVLPLPASPEPVYSSAPAAKATAARAQLRHSVFQRRTGHACRFCGQTMVSLGLALYHCRSCRHFENVRPVSFLDSASSCNCDYCCHNLRHAG